MSDLFIVVSLYAKDGRDRELRQDLIEVVEPSRNDEGNLGYELFADRSDARRFVFFERWASKEAQQKHDTETEHIRRFQERGAANVAKVEFFVQLERIA